MVYLRASLVQDIWLVTVWMGMGVEKGGFLSRLLNRKDTHSVRSFRISLACKSKVFLLTIRYGKHAFAVCETTLATSRVQSSSTIHFSKLYFLLGKRMYMCLLTAWQKQISSTFLSPFSFLLFICLPKVVERPVTSMLMLLREFLEPMKNCNPSKLVVSYDKLVPTYTYYRMV